MRKQELFTFTEDLNNIIDGLIKFRADGENSVFQTTNKI